MLRRWPYVLTFLATLETGHTINVLVNVRQTIFPQFVLPCRSGKIILGDTTISIQSHQLASLLVDGHLGRQISHAGFHTSFRVLESVLLAVLIEIDPRIVIELWHQLRDHDRVGVRFRNDVIARTGGKQKQTKANSSHGRPRKTGNIGWLETNPPRRTSRQNKVHPSSRNPQKRSPRRGGLHRRGGLDASRPIELQAR